jgi:hypothetical protein
MDALVKKGQAAGSSLEILFPEKTKILRSWVGKAVSPLEK